jgi:hypothetical protein
MSDYSKLLRHPFWQRKKNAILERDNYQCRHCFEMLQNLQVHHLYYGPAGSMPWEVPDDALITLCELCHEKEEFIKWLRNTIEYSLFESRFSSADIAEIRELIIKRVKENKHAKSVRQYMKDLKILIAA